MGRSLGVFDTSYGRETITVSYTASMVTQKVFIATQPCTVVDISGVTRVAGSGGACTVSFYKAPSGTAVGSGTLLHAGSFNVVGTADTHQTLTLVGNQSALTLNAGDAIGYVLTGTPTSAVGMIQVSVDPVGV